MSSININVTEHLAVFTNMPVLLTSGSENVDKIHVDVDDTWNGFAMAAVFYQNKGEMYYSLVDGNGDAAVPNAIMDSSRVTCVALYGINGNQRTTTNALQFRIEQGVQAVEVAMDPTITEQLFTVLGTQQEQINALKDTKAEKTAVSSPYNFKGSCLFSELPESGNEVNDTYYVTDFKCKYTWDGEGWYQSSLNETEYQEELNALSEEVNEQVSQLSSEIENADKRITNYCKRSYQLFNKESERLNLYVASDGTVTQQSNSYMMLIPVASEDYTKRFVIRADNVVKDGTIFRTFYTDNTSIEVGGTVTVSSTVGSDTGFYGAYTSGVEKHYLGVVVYRSDGNVDIVNDIFDKTVVAQKNNGYDVDYQDYYILDVKKENLPDDYDEDVLTKAQELVNQNNWYGKTIIWFGTSIPEGKRVTDNKSYPQLVGEMLGANVINMALSSSCARANVRTGDYVDGHAENMLYSLSQTAEEKENMITNWDSIVPVLRNGSDFATLTDSQKEKCRASTFEKRLLPYLDGTYEMPDLFVFDHGHNDYKYKMPDGSSDITLHANTDTIGNGLLADDTYMTANDFENLKHFMDITNLNPAQNPATLHSMNRNCFEGAMNFLIELILYHNPRARIVFVGNYGYGKTELDSEHATLSDLWNFPLIEVGKYLGWSGKWIPGSKDYWGDGKYDMSAQRVYVKDGTHPHTDTTGQALDMYAKVISSHLKICV